MASQGPLYAGAGATDSSLGGNDWGGAGNIISDNGSTADVTCVATNSYYLVSSSHGFTIPDEATIDGIVVEVNRWTTNPDAMNDYRARIVKGGVIGSVDKSIAGNWSDSDTSIATYGSSTELWGQAWTAAEVNASGFGFAMAVEAPVIGSALVDYCRITVYYTPLVGGGNLGGRVIKNIGGGAAYRPAPFNPGSGR